MCFLSLILPEPLLKWSLFLVSIFYLGMSGWLIYIGVLVKNSGLWRITIDNSIFLNGQNLHLLLFLSFLGAGCLSCFTAFMGMVTVCKEG